MIQRIGGGSFKRQNRYSAGLEDFLQAVDILPSPLFFFSLEFRMKDLIPYFDKLSAEQLEKIFCELSGYEEKPVGIDEFLDSPRFLGNYFGESGLYPYWRKVLRDIYPSPLYSPYWLISFRGSIGIGKTTVGCASMLYEIHRLLCSPSPQKEAGLLPSTRILMAIFNVTLSLATDVVWEKLSQMMVSSPYFSSLAQGLQGRRRADTALFPEKNVDVFMGSRISHTLGRAVNSALLDESNFEIIGGQVYDTFNSLLRRMESRFLSLEGKISGKLWVISSETDKFSVVNKIIDQYRGKDGVYVSQAALWDVKSSRYSGERFWVYVGSESKQPEIIKDDSHLLQKEFENCIRVPIEHRDTFEGDLNAALRDLAGRPTTSNYKLFRLKERLHKAAEVSPLFPDTFQLDFDDDTDQIANYLLHKKYIGNHFNPNTPRCIHVDIGISGDRLGIAASYISGWKTRVSRDQVTFEEITDQVPEVITEWSVGIEPTAGKRVPLYKVRVFIQWLQRQKYLIQAVTFDGFQSEDSVQLLVKAGIDASIVSLDRNSIPYTTVRNHVYDGYVKIPKSKLLLRELEELEVSSDGNKVDHPKKFIDGTNGSKDIADAVSGSIYGVIINSHKIKHLNLAAHSTTPRDSELAQMFWGAQ